MCSNFCKLLLVCCLGALVCSCGKKTEPTFIEKVCVSEGTSVSECACMAQSLQKGLSKERYNFLEERANERGAQGLAVAMLELSEIERHSIGTEMSSSCTSPNDDDAHLDATQDSVPVKANLSKDEAMTLACQVGGNTEKMCLCWTDFVKSSVSKDVYNKISQGAQRGANEGLSAAVHALPEQTQMSVGIALMEAGTVCAVSE